MPCTASGLATTGRPAAMASSTLFFTPLPEDIGVTRTLARRSAVATSGTPPVTSASSARSARVG